jgi:formiminotetrahydrofolate cyclodeaminase
VASLHELPLPELVGAFASDAPAPGGGSAGALAGSVAAALAAMVGGLTVNKPKYAEAQAQAEAAIAQGQALSQRLLLALSADAAAFDAIVAARRLPKETEAEQAARLAAIEAATQGATEAPMGVAEACLAAAALGLEMLQVGNRNAASDAAVAVLFGVAGAEASLLNVAINLPGAKDGAWVASVRPRLTGAWAEAVRLRAALGPALEAAGLEAPGLGAQGVQA